MIRTEFDAELRTQTAFASCQTQSCPQLPRFAGCLVDYQCATTSTTALRCIGKLRLVVAEDLLEHSELLVRARGNSPRHFASGEPSISLPGPAGEPQRVVQVLPVNPAAWGAAGLLGGTHRSEKKR